MKQIKAYIRPVMEDRVVDVLEELPNPPGLTVMHVEGWGQPKDGMHHKLTPQVRLETIVTDGDVDRIVTTLRETACTGHYGDGKIFVSEVDEAMRIRDGETGEEVV